MPPSELRKEAREALKGRWKPALLTTLIYALISGLFSYVLKDYFIFELAWLVISVPITLGLTISFLNIKREKDISCFDFLKDGFSRFGRAWGIAWYTIVKMFIPFLCIVASIILFVVLAFSSGFSLLNKTASVAEYSMQETAQEAASIAKFAMQETNGSIPTSSITTPRVTAAPAKTSTITTTAYIVLVVVAVILYLTGIVYGIARGLLYSLSYYICFDNPTLSTKDCVQRSEDLMKGHRGDLFLTELSFIGWAILAVIPFGIGVLWLIPYIQVTIAAFYERLSVPESKKVDGDVKIDSQEV